MTYEGGRFFGGVIFEYDISNTTYNPYSVKYNFVYTQNEINMNSPYSINNYCFDYKKKMGISDENLSGNVMVSPNPTSDYLLINNVENASIQIYNMLGNRVMDINNISNEYKVDVSNLPQGAYILKIIQNNQVITKRINLLK